MVSERKLAANRRNAKRSTGPKTPAGKAAVRYNALKHGLLAKEVVVTASDCPEDRVEFDRLHCALVDDLQPIGVLEQMLVEKIAVACWRLRRVVRVEAAEIRRRQSLPDIEGTEAEEIHASVLASLPGLRALPGGASKHLERTSPGIDQLLKLVADARFAVQVNGCLTESGRERLLDAYGKEEGSVGHTCFVHSYWVTDRDQIAEEDPKRAAQGPTPEECKTLMLFTLDMEHRRLLSLRRKVRKREALERERQHAKDDLDQACCALPPDTTADRLLRYETAFERQLYRAMAELERLQRRRDAVTPPLPPEASPN
jgi:hypothetical protein